MLSCGVCGLFGHRPGDSHVAAVNDVALCTAHAQGQPRPLYLTGDAAHMAQFQENAAWL